MLVAEYLGEPPAATATATAATATATD
jgi:hypothetical protein